MYSFLNCLYNIKITKVVIKKYEQGWYKGEIIQSAYKYLGIFFTPKLSWSKSCNNLSHQGEKAMNVLYNYCRRNNISIQNSLFLFDRMIVRILTYGSDVWGYVYYPCIESVHLKFCRRLLSVSSSTCKSAIYGELGRYPIQLTLIYNLIKYWIKVPRLPNYRYPNACYSML